MHFLQFQHTLHLLQIRTIDILAYRNQTPRTLRVLTARIAGNCSLSSCAAVVSLRVNIVISAAIANLDIHLSVAKKMNLCAEFSIIGEFCGAVIHTDGEVLALGKVLDAVCAVLLLRELPYISGVGGVLTQFIPVNHILLGIYGTIVCLVRPRTVGTHDKIIAVGRHLRYCVLQFNYHCLEICDTGFPIHRLPFELHVHKVVGVVEHHFIVFLHKLFAVASDTAHKHIMPVVIGISVGHSLLVQFQMLVYQVCLGRFGRNQVKPARHISPRAVERSLYAIVIQISDIEIELAIICDGEDKPFAGVVFVSLILTCGHRAEPPNHGRGLFIGKTEESCVV